MVDPATTSAHAPRTVVVLRVRQVAGAVCLLSGALAGIMFAAALIGHLALLFLTALMALIANLLSEATVEGCRAWLLNEYGAWVGLDGQRRSRAGRPGWFKAWLTMHIALVVVWVGAAVYLASVVTTRF